MTQITWDATGERKYETGVDHGVLYPQNVDGTYGDGVAWNGLINISEAPSGAEASPQFADNIKYLNLMSAEEFGGTIEAFSSPIEFDQCDGTARPIAGVTVAQQRRVPFGLSYRNLIGNDIVGTDFGEKIHLVYGALAAPSEKSRGTVNESPEATTFSWEFTTTPVEVPGLKPSAHLSIDSTEVKPENLARLKEVVYGTAGEEARLPLPAEVFDIFESESFIVVRPVAPTFAANTITIPTVTGVIYLINNKVVTGAVVITEDTLVTSRPAKGYRFSENVDTDWAFEVV